MEVLMSDLHISSPLFKVKSKIIDLYNDPRVDAVYILGDLFDTWEGCLCKTIEKHADLIDVINESGKTVAIIKGNHDPDVSTLKEIFNNVYVATSFSTEFFGKKAMMVHGDEFDSSEFWGKLLFYTFQWPLGRVGINGKAFVRNMIYKSVLWRNDARYNSIVLEMERKLVDKYKFDYDIIISGHTHITKMVREGKTTFVNTGTLLHNPSYIIVEDNTIRIRRL